ncbi:MAG: ABC transporter substrate-binding protein [Actinomycetota bacterium]
MRRSLATALLLAITAACSSSGPATIAKKDTGPAFPVTVTAANGAVTLAAKPARIVSMSATATEMLFAIDAGAQVIAADDNSTYPANAPKTKLSAYQPNVEAIAGYHPDLVVASDDINHLVASLKALSIPVLLEPAATTIDDSYAQITQLGTATGHTAEASTLVTQMKGRIQAIVAAAPHFSAAPTYYYELDNTYFSVTSHTFIGGVFGMLGMRNIADPADKKASGYPQLSAEYIVQSDPQLIFLADTKCCGQSLASVRKRAGWDKMTAVRDGRVVSLDDDVASRWGPRIVDLLQTVEQSLEALKQAA